MKNKFNWAVALFLLSFFLPVIEIQVSLLRTESIYGWEAASNVVTTWDWGKNNLFENPLWQTLHYIIANLANPLALIVIIMHYTKHKNVRLKWWLSLISILSALYWAPVFFGNIFTYFSFGYWLWLSSLILINFYSNEASFKRPPKNA